jgi:hypothetical protein
LTNTLAYYGFLKSYNTGLRTHTVNYQVMEPNWTINDDVVMRLFTLKKIGGHIEIARECLREEKGYVRR